MTESQEARPRWTRLLRLLTFAPLLVAAACTEPADPSSEPPIVSITAPSIAATFAGGDEVEVRAAALDVEGSSLLPGQMEWWVVFHHAAHTHPFQPVTPGAAGRFTIPRRGEMASDVFYRVYARAVNDQGRADTAFTDLHPRLMTLTILTEPAGLDVNVDHQRRATPFTTRSVVGMEWPVGVPSGQTQGSVEYEFSSWSNAGIENQVLVTPDTNLTLTVYLRDAGIANVPPSVSLSTPAGGSIVTAGSATAITADASDQNGTVTLVEFFVGSTKVGTDQAAPFSIEWTPTGTGQRILTARATDNRGAYTVSPPVAVTVQTASGSDRLAPTAALVSPTHGTRELSGAVSITAAASDDVGVTAVDFLVDGFLLSTDTSAPWEASIPSTGAYASGAHTLSVRARDAAGNESALESSTVTFAGTVAVPAGFTLTPGYVGNFGDIITAAVVAPDGRIFVAEQSGKLRVVSGGVLLPTPAITVPADNAGERGLIGVALHPDFASNGFIYLYYTAAGVSARNRIVRYVLDGDVAVPSSQTLLAELPVLGAAKHNGGAMAFGGDGKLYVAVGDNADGSNAPLLTTPFGKILRFNSDGSIPTDNPFYSQTAGINRAIWARGLRNPFSFAIETGTNRMLINDVGAADWEEINLGRAGADYGWPSTEGPTTNPAFDAPLLAIRHADSPTLFEATAVVGATFYHPQTASFGAAYVGSFFFADYVYGWVYRLDGATGKANAFARVAGFVTGVLTAPDGSLLVLNGRAIDRISR